MFKALMKKQQSELMALMFRANSKRGNSTNTAVYMVIMVVLAGLMAVIFFMLSLAMCAPLVEAGLDWLYFAMTVGLSTVLGIFGSVFSTYSGVYEAKDNELLLSLPIKPGMILIVRLLAIYVMTFIFEAVALVPAGIAYMIFGDPGVLWFVIFPVMVILLPMLALAISCILGWLLALIIPRINSKSVKSLITLLISVVFLAAYFVFYSRINTLLQYVVTNSESIGETVKGGLYPLYCIGRAAEGDPLSFAIVVLFVVLVFALIYVLLSRNFIKIAVGKRSVSRARYVKKPVKAGSADSALLKKEFSHYISSTPYMLNCSLGSVLLIVAAVALVIKGGDIVNMFSEIEGIEGVMAVIACACVAFIITMNPITAPSITLEGNTLWLLQSLPVDGKKVLMSKIRLHMILTAPAAFICSVVAMVVLRPEPLAAVMMPLFSVAFTLFCASLGLIVNLFMPKLDWTNETVAVKQSGSVLVSMLAEYVVLIAFGVLYFVTVAFVSAGIFLLISTLSVSVISVLIIRFLFTKGVKMLAEL